MVIYNNLPIYKDSYDLLIDVFKLVKNFSKEYKYTIWDKIKNEIVNLITSIYRANSNFSKRLTNLQKAREHVEVLKLYIRLSKDLHIINIENYANISLKIETLSKQLFAWEKSCTK